MIKVQLLSYTYQEYTGEYTWERLQNISRGKELD